PRSTLFPYTTLFRSELEAADRVDDGTVAALRAEIEVHPEDEPTFGRRPGRPDGGRDRLGQARVEREMIDRVGSRGPAVLVVHVEDRKSTRLNSSHDQ